MLEETFEYLVFWFFSPSHKRTEPKVYVTIMFLTLTKRKIVQVCTRFFSATCVNC